MRLWRNNYIPGVVINAPSSLSGMAIDYVTADIDFSTSDTLTERLRGSWISIVWGHSCGIKWFGTQTPLGEEEAKNFIRTILLLGKGALLLPINRRYLQPGWKKKTWSLGNISFWMGYSGIIALTDCLRLGLQKTLDCHFTAGIVLHWHWRWHWGTQVEKTRQDNRVVTIGIQRLQVQSLILKILQKVRSIPIRSILVS